MAFFSYYFPLLSFCVFLFCLDFVFLCFKEIFNNFHEFCNVLPGILLKIPLYLCQHVSVHVPLGFLFFFLLFKFVCFRFFVFQLNVLLSFPFFILCSISHFLISFVFHYGISIPSCVLSHQFYISSPFLFML